MSTSSRLWWIFGTAWALLLLGLGVWSASHSPATIRDQSTITSGKQTIDTVVAELRETVPAETLFQDSGYHESPCRITPMRDGTNAVRVVTVTGLNGNEAAALRAITTRFKDSRLQPGDGVPTGFFYDAGNFTVVRGEIIEPGKLVVELKTGCRPNN